MSIIIMSKTKWLKSVFATQSMYVKLKKNSKIFTTGSWASTIYNNGMGDKRAENQTCNWDLSGMCHRI